MNKPDWKDRDFVDISSYTNMGYPLWMQNIGQSAFRDSALGLIREATADAHPLRRVVDLGCGVGDWTVRYADFAREVVGMDISQGFIEQAREHARERGVQDRVEFRVGDTAGFDDFTGADLICFGALFPCLETEVVEQLVDRSTAAQELGDVTYVRATVVTPGRTPHRTEDGSYYRDQRFYRQLFEQHGYTVEMERFSSEIVPMGLLQSVSKRLKRRAADWLSSPIRLPLRSVRAWTRDLVFCNWIFRKQ